MKAKLTVVVLTLIITVALGSLTGLLSCQRQQESALKPIDQAALQTLVDTTAKELLISGAVVPLRTPQGELAVSYGTTLLGANSQP
jgi:D-alanyl-D-alanine carboxypeptidase